MKIFKDNCDKEWSVDIDTLAVERVRANAGIDIMSVFATDLLSTLAEDIIKAASVMYWVLKPDLDEAQIDDVKWAKRIKGRYAHLHEVLQDEIVDFFTSLGGKRAKLMTLGKRAMDLVEKRTMEKAEQWLSEERVMERLEEEIQKIFGPPSTTQPESSDSTPAT